jgi:5-methylcytosine-specific restriction endonuclease McrA
MPYVNKPRPYAKEYAQYDGTPAVKKKRALRNKARREMEKAGLVHKGDGLDVDHKTPLSKGGSTARSNLRAVPASKNRSFSRNADSSVKSNVPKKK